MNRAASRPEVASSTRAPTTCCSFTRGYSFRFGVDGLPADGTLVDLTEFNPSALWAMGNMVSTPDDLNTFYEALLGERMLPNSLAALMKRPR